MEQNHLLNFREKEKADYNNFLLITGRKHDSRMHNVQCLNYRLWT